MTMLMPISHQYHQSDDPEWKENPIDKKRSPYWCLSEKLKGKYESVGLYNKNTSNKRQKDVSIYGQTVQEADWIKEQVPVSFPCSSSKTFHIRQPKNLVSG